MSKRKLPIEAYDPRYLQLWLRAAREVIVIGETDPSREAWLEESRGLTQFNVDANAVRKRAQELNHPGWQDLYRASLRMRKHRGKIVYLECGPRAEALETLLTAAVGPGRPTRQKTAGLKTHIPELLTVPEDILEGLFPEDAKHPQEKREVEEKTP